MVKLSYQQIYTKLPEEQIVPLTELNKQMWQHLACLNDSMLTGKECSRTDQWLMELSSLQPLPLRGYEMRKIKQVTVMKNGHVHLYEDQHYYSVPYELIGKKLRMHRLDKNQVLRLADCTFMKQKENIIITGSTGIGKSHLASALGHQACTLGYRVLYQHSTKLFARMKIAKADGSYLKELAKIERQHLLLIDDFGILPLDAQSRATLMEIIEDRHGKSSTIITSQIPVSKWHEIIGEQTIADAILDRIVHDAHRIEMKGESLRKKKQPKNQEEIVLQNFKN
jgi:DNA replication protein DnaC